jgi:uncharacterized protein
MAQEILLSPGISIAENDQSQITTGLVTAGLALVGPTVKGKVNIPTLVTSYSDFRNKFGDAFESASNVYEYLTSVSAYNYFQQGGTSVLVTRVASGSYTSATDNGVETSIPTTTLSTKVDRLKSSVGSFNITGSTSTAAQTVFASDANVTASITLTNSTSLNTVTVTSASGTFNVGGTITFTSQSLGATVGDGSDMVFTLVSNALQGQNAFELETLTQGDIMNSVGPLGSNGTLLSGSANNVRWQIVSPNTASGVFSLVIRQGNDTTTNPSVLETWPNLSLDPNSPNYISRVVGDKTVTAELDATTGEYYLKEVGSYNNASRYVRVKSVLTPTPNRFNNDGSIKTQFTASIPVAASGSFGGATGKKTEEIAPLSLFENINATDTQGLIAENYNIAANLLSNSENYDFSLISTPGLTQEDYSSTVSKFITLAEERGDCFYILDLAKYNSTLGTVTNKASELNTNYAAAYWPWVQVLSQASGKLTWVPASTVMPGVYTFSDRVAAEWFAPAGLNRGGVGGAIQAERKLSTTDRNTLYEGKVNPIASFPGVGLTAFGQKTLQTQASALDRVNVRRLLIALKRYIGTVARTLIFEQNTITTRNNFISQVNPYLETVQQRQGLFAYKVVMDDTNNTADVIDRNQLVGQIYIQPTKTVEYIYLTFNITPTGVEFQ